MTIWKKEFSLVMIFVLLALSIPWAEAGADYRLKTVTPSLQNALNHRKMRSHKLQALKAQGVIGENNLGFIQVLKSGSWFARTFKSSDQAKILVERENHDRKLIYNAIVQQNHLQPNQIAEVEKEFAKVRRDRAKQNDLIQDSKGKWIRK